MIDNFNGNLEKEGNEGEEKKITMMRMFANGKVNVKI